MPESNLSQRLSAARKFSYGVGHVLNDLCASMWFTYLLIFYHKVIGLNNIMAGNLSLIGQVADAVATPFVGYESDRMNGFCGYGKRKSWHLLGCVCVAASFSFIFMPVLGWDPIYYSTGGSGYASLLYYAPFIVIFQFGWASTQISHLSLIPSLSECEHVKVGLNSIRYAFTVISNLAVYVIAWALLTYNSKTASTDISPPDYTTFRLLAFIVIGIGVVFVIIFHVGTKEVSPAIDSTLTNSVRRRMYVMCWLKTYQFYMVAILYMCTRLVVNLSQVYLTMYLTETLSLPKTYIAIVPLMVYISGFLITFPIKFLSRKFGKKIVYLFGLLCIVGASIWFYLLRPESKVDTYLVMVAGALNGVGGSTILVLSLSLTADLIDQNTESAAFVYGAMSFTDKLSNGLAIQIIQIVHPCKSTACCAACAPFYRYIMTFVPMGFAALAFIALLFVRRRETEYTMRPQDEPDDMAPINTSQPTSYGSLNGDTPGLDCRVAILRKSSTEPAPIGSAADSDCPQPDNMVVGERTSLQTSHLSGSAHHRPSFIIGSTPDRTFHSPR